MNNELDISSNYVSPTKEELINVPENEIFTNTVKKSPFVSICIITTSDDLKNKSTEFLKHLPYRPDVEIIIIETVEFKEVDEKYRNETNHWEEYDLNIDFESDQFIRGTIHYIKDTFSFSKARNVAKELARGKWILSLDMDECLPEMYHDYFFELLKLVPDEIIMCNVGIISAGMNIEGNKIDRIITNGGRVVRNEPWFKWTGYVHEHINDGDIRAECVIDLPIHILHNGYDQSDELMIKKFERNIRGLGRELFENHNKKIWLRSLDYMRRSIDVYIQYIEKQELIKSKQLEALQYRKYFKK